MIVAIIAPSNWKIGIKIKFKRKFIKAAMKEFLAVNFIPNFPIEVISHQKIFPIKNIPEFNVNKPINKKLMGYLSPYRIITNQMIKKLTKQIGKIVILKIYLSLSTTSFLLFTCDMVGKKTFKNINKN